MAGSISTKKIIENFEKKHLKHFFLGRTVLANKGGNGKNRLEIKEKIISKFSVKSLTVKNLP